MRIRPRSMLLPVVLAALAACSDGNDNNGGSSAPAPEPISIPTANADRCEMLDQQNCLLPFPSSFYTVADDSTVTGRRINISIDSTPKNKQGVPMDPAEWNRNDGFSPSQMLLAQVPGIDLVQSGAPLLGDLTRSQAPDSPIVVIRASTGEQHLVFTELDANTEDPLEQALIIRPMEQFERGERYIVALRNLQNTAGETLPAPEVFAAFRDSTLTDNPAIEQRRESMEAIFAELADAGIERQSLYLAWDFNVASVENITGRMLHIRDEAFADLGNAAPQFTVEEIIDFGDCPPLVNCEQNEYISRRITGTYTVPNFLDSDEGGAGSAFYYAAEGDELPSRMNGDNTLQARFICQVPRSVAEDFGAAPKAAARPSLYGHGLLGSAGEVERGTGANINIMADTYQMMFCATDWIGFSSQDVGAAIAALQDFSLIRPVFDRQQQGFLNFMYLARLLKHPQGFASDPAFQAGGQPVFDNSNVYYDGNSQGGILGGALMGVIQDVTRGVLGVPGMTYSTLLRRSIDFETYSLFFSGSATGDEGGGYPSVMDQTQLLSMVQMLWDRAEASGYAYHIESNTLPNTPSHAVLLQVAYGDHQVSMWTAEAMARSIGARLRVPALEPGRHPDENPFVNLEPVPAGDYTGSVLTYWDDGPVGGGAEDGGTAPPPSANLPPFEPDFGEAPHSLPRKDPNAQRQKSEFLKPEGESRFVDTCDPTLPCTTDGYVPGG